MFLHLAGVLLLRAALVLPEETFRIKSSVQPVLQAEAYQLAIKAH